MTSIEESIRKECGAREKSISLRIEEQMQQAKRDAIDDLRYIIDNNLLYPEGFSYVMRKIKNLYPYSK